MKKIIIILLLVFTLFNGCYKRPPEEIPTVIKKDVRVMSFNILRGNWIWGWTLTKRKDKIVDIIQKYDPDIVCIQESLDFQFKDLKESLIEYDSYGVGRGDGKEKGEFCGIFYKKERFAVLESGTFWFSKTPDTAGTKSWGSIVPRTCSWVKMIDGESSSGFYLYNTHLTFTSKKAKEESVKLLKERASEPCIITGDFNMGIKDPIMAPLLDYNYIDIGEKQYDHIICSKDMKIEEYNLDKSKNYPSDHYALIADIVLEK